MKKIVFLFLAFLAVNLFSRDWEISKGEKIIGLSRGYIKMDSGYDAEGKKQSVNNPADAVGTALTMSFGLADRLSLGIVLLHGDYDFKYDSYDRSGFLRPQVSIDYVTEKGSGFYFGMKLPAGSEEVVGNDPEAEYELGFMYRPSTDVLRLNSGISYVYTLEGSDESKQDEIHILVEPQFKIDNVYILSTGIKCIYNFEEKEYGEKVENSNGYLISSKLGFSYLYDDYIEIGASYEFPLSGDNYVPAAAALTLGMAVYL